MEEFCKELKELLKKYNASIAIGAIKENLVLSVGNGPEFIDREFNEEISQYDL